MRLAPALLLLPFALSCSTGNFGSTSPIPPTSPAPPAAPAPPAPPTPATIYHAYGDSITFGIGVVNPPTDAYPALLATLHSLTLTNLAIIGDQACDVPTRQLFPAADSPTLATPTLYSLLISTNDVDAKGPGPYEAIFNLCHQATLAWLATPLESKLLATAPAVTATGPNHLDTTSNFNALFTDAQAATLNLLFTRPTPGALYLWYRIVDGSPGTFTVTLDGALAGTLTTGTTPTISTQNHITNSFALFRIPTTAAGPHTLVLTQTSAGPSGLGLVAIGFPPATRPAGSPRVLVGITPMQLNGYGVVCNTPDSANCQAYIADITANVNLLASDGLDIELFNTRKYETGTPADMGDQIHPNQTGHYEILHAITDIY